MSKTERVVKRAPTLKDVASLAGVSPFTVSAVINGARSNTQVSAATRQRILESAEQVNYHPSAVARSLASQRTYNVGVQFGVLEPTEAIGNAYASALLQGIMQEAAAHRYNLLLFSQAWVDADRSAPGFRDRRTDGVILVAPLTDTDMLSALSALPLPLVAISPDPLCCPDHVPSVDVDNFQGITMAVEHLVRLGHRRIAHITGNPNVASVAQRKSAFLQTIEACGLPPVEPEYVVEATYDASTVAIVLPQLMRLPMPPTAIIAGNDNIALSVLSVARSLGILVPQQLSVIGFDDIPSAGQVTPSLTTIRQPLMEIGVQAVQLLLKEIESARDGRVGQGYTPIRIAPQFIDRESTARIP